MDQFGSSAPAWANGAVDSQEEDSRTTNPSSSSTTDAAPKQQNHAILQGCGDVKPRLTKDQLEILEAEFEIQHKPSTSMKKTYAERLGVPLDKINNWFQNRRAKVKQDLKKQQMSMANIYYAVPHHPQYVPPTEQYQFASGTQEFYQANADVDQASFPQPTAAPLPTDLPLRSQPPAHQDYNLALQSISESEQPASYDGIFHNLLAAGYSPAMTGMTGAAAHAPPAASGGFDQTGLFDESQLVPVSNMTGSVTPFGDTFPGFGQNPFDYQGFISSMPAPMQPVNGNSSMSFELPSPLTAQPPLSSDTANFNSSLTSAFSAWTEDGKDSTNASPGTRKDDRNVNLTDSPSEETPAPYNAGEVPWSSAQAQSVNHYFEQQQAMYQQNNTSGQVLLSSTTDQNEPRSRRVSSGFESPVPMSNEEFLRKNSSTTNLTESMSTIGIQPRQSVDASFKQPSQPSSIAARRQRPRPVPIGQAALRSMSYSSGMPTSPNASLTLSPDQTLRRIRSSNGVINGRIQKPTPGSAQRSPLNLTFAQAAAASPGARQTSFGLVTNPGSAMNNGNLAPPTPLTPNEFSRFPSWQSHGMIKTCPTTGAQLGPDTTSTAWAANPSTTASFPNVASPPSTPLENGEQTVQYRTHVRNAPVYRDTPPQSAPASQQCFPRNTFAPVSQQPVELQNSTEYATMMTRPQPNRRPSLPGSSTGYDLYTPISWDIPVPMVNPAGELQLGFPTQLQQPVLDGMQHSQKPASSQHMSSGFQTFNAAMSRASPQASVVTPDFFVHEYAPPQPAGQAASPPKPPSTQPKSYTWMNQGSQDFEASS